MGQASGGREKKRDEAAQLRQRAAALLASVFIMLALLVSAVMSAEARAYLIAAALPGSGAGSSPSPSPAPDPLLEIKLADVDGDVPEEVVIKLIGILPLKEVQTAREGEPTVLVYHTHDSEAYRPEREGEYEASGSCRTLDNRYNVYAVGEELCRILLEKYGIIALHADEKHEQPLLTTAYLRSLETMRKYREEYPTLQTFIDLHRDGVADTGFEDDYVTVEGKQCARMMFVVGTGKSGKSAQLVPGETPDTVNDMPDFESNYALALRLTESLLGVNGRFMRNIRVKSGKYNQQVSSQCLLVEVGHNGNTLEQAKNSMEWLAWALAEVYGKV